MSRRPIQSSVRSEAAGADVAELLRQHFREALASWVSGVTVLAVSDGTTIEAITVTAFASVSLEPPLVLVCAGEQAAPLPLLRERQRFTVSLLAQQQRRAASVIADRMPGRQLLFRSAEEPAVTGAIAALSCRLWAEYPGGDHRIIVGEVDAIRFERRADPLVYHDRRYRSLA